MCQLLMVEIAGCFPVYQIIVGFLALCVGLIGRARGQAGNRVVLLIMERRELKQWLAMKK